MVVFVVVFDGYLETFDCGCWLDSLVNFMIFPGYVVLAVVWGESGFYGFVALLFVFLIAWYLVGVVALLGPKTFREIWLLHRGILIVQKENDSPR